MFIKKARLLAWLLALCLISSVGFSEGELLPARGYRFQLTMHLNDPAGEKGGRSSLSGYADLLDALVFEGTWAQAVDSDEMDLHLVLRPVDPAADPLTLRIFGTPAFRFLTSPVLGQEQLVFSNDSLLPFGVKTYEHLGIPLQYAAFLSPHTWNRAFSRSVREWKKMSDSRSAKGVVPRKNTNRMIKQWNSQLDSNTYLQTLISSIGLDTGMEEKSQAFFTGIPDWFSKRVTRGKNIRVSRKNNAETWSSGGGTFARVETPEGTTRITLTLPAMDSGFQPAFFYENTRQEQSQALQLTAQIQETASPDEPLLDLNVSGEGLPLDWPQDCDAEMNVNLRGKLFQNLAFSAFLRGTREGRLTLEFFPPIDESRLSDPVLTVSGTVEPLEGDVSVPAASEEDISRSVDILRVNDVTLAEFISGIQASFVPGMIRFLIGIPTTACQAVLNDLTDSGAVQLLLGD